MALQIRADQVLMAGVVGLGALAVYWLVTQGNKPRPPGDEPIYQPGPDIPPLGGPATDPASYANNWIGRMPAPPGSVVLTRSAPGATKPTFYRGRIELGYNLRPGEPPPPPMAPSTLERLSSPAEIATALEAIGFGDVQVFTSPPQGTFFSATAGPTPTSRWFTATWRGRPDGPPGGPSREIVAMPRQIVMVYQTPEPPPPRTFATFWRPYSAIDYSG